MSFTQNEIQIIQYFRKMQVFTQATENFSITLVPNHLDIYRCPDVEPIKLPPTLDKS